MKRLPANIILEKNKLAQNSAWLILLDIDIETEDTIYLVRNNESITFDGVSYEPFAFELDSAKQDSKGKIPSVSLSVSNVTRMFARILDTHSGGVGATVTIRVVNSDLLDENYAELTINYDVISTEVTEEWITFSLGAPNPLRQRYPKYRYISGHCNWQFGSAECGYTPGATETCARTLASCQSKENQDRYGGFLGLMPGGMRVA
jgi:lambda family phage minor tail protein L